MDSPNLAERIARIELLVLDVDGVLTDGRIIYSDDGREIKEFHVRDGVGLRYWRDAGKQSAIISGRNSPAVQRRAAELGIAHVCQGTSAKLAALKEILAKTGLVADQICAIGDDLPDLPVIRQVGLGVAVADACPEVRAVSQYVTQAPGGCGAVREIVELLLRGQGQWQGLLERLHAEHL